MTYSVVEHLWIPMQDGCRLGARLWLPDTAQEVPVPVILEYIPYRKRDGTRERDEPMHSYFALSGYAAVRVDMRGTGESDGHMADEYLLQEQDDALEVMSWLAQQAWCNGRIGMMGKSWGGFNSLQVAMRRPPELKAIITAYSTDNRYTDDIHYMGGCLLNDNMWWGGIMMVFQSRPPDPAVVGEQWREIWKDRLERLPFFPALWLDHQTYDTYWKHGSVCKDYAAIQCPVLAVGGWVDSYTNAVPRLLENLKTISQGIIGPWGHVYPHDGVPGPAIGFLQEAVSWWDRWLKDAEPSGTGDRGALTAWIEAAERPATTRTQSEGEWISLTHWPSAAITETVLPFHAHGQMDLKASEAEVGLDLGLVCSTQSHGRAGGEWMGVGCAGELPADQRLDDGEALLFRSTPLREDCVILGFPEVALSLASDVPLAQIVVRLCEVFPDGATTRVSYQVLNLAHRRSHEHPEPLTPGQIETVHLRLNACGHRFRAGNRIAVAIGTAYWPLIWPAPYLATLRIFAPSALHLPVLDMAHVEVKAAGFPPPERGTVTPLTQLSAGSLKRYSTQDYVSGTMTYVTDAIGGVFGTGVFQYDETETRVEHNLRRSLIIRDDNPLSARYELCQFYGLQRPGQNITIDVVNEMTSDLDMFFLKATVTVREDGQVFFEREFQKDIPRSFL